MQKRQVLRIATLIGALPAAGLNAHAAREAGQTPALLTVSGALRVSNRGPADKALDQMMSKHGVAFERAQTYGFEALAAMPAQTIRPTLEYDGKKHTLKGPALATVLERLGAPADASTKVGMRAVDGYNAELTLGELRRLGFIVATHLDGQPMALGGLGPLWAVYEPDRHPDQAAKPLPERFSACPWGLYHIQVG